jgi:chromosomal replication initiation ATPase DnaA
MTFTKKEQAEIDRTFEVVGELTGATREEIVSSSRERGVAEARWLAMYCVRNRMNLSLQRIGQVFGGRDHTTVINALKQIKDRKAYDADLYDKLEDAMDQLGAAKPMPEANTSESEILRLILDAQELINKAASMIGATNKS